MTFLDIMFDLVVVTFLGVMFEHLVATFLDTIFDLVDVPKLNMTLDQNSKHHVQPSYHRETEQEVKN